MFFTSGKRLLPPCRLSTLFNRKLPVRKLVRLSSILNFSILFEKENMNTASYYSSLAFLKCCLDDKMNSPIFSLMLPLVQALFSSTLLTKESEVQDRVEEAHGGLQRRQIAYLPWVCCVFRTTLVSVKADDKIQWNHALFSLNLWNYFSKTYCPVEPSFPFLFIASKIIRISLLGDLALHWISQNKSRLMAKWLSTTKGKTWLSNPRRRHS